MQGHSIQNQKTWNSSHGVSLTSLENYLEFLFPYLKGRDKNISLTLVTRFTRVPAGIKCKSLQSGLVASMGERTNIESHF